MLTYSVTATRGDAHGSTATAHGATIDLDTSVEGRPAALNPAETLLAALAACMIKSAERAAPMIKVGYRGLEVRLRAERRDAPPAIVAIDYELIVDTDEPDHRLELLHTNVRKYGTVSNTLAAALTLTGRVRRKGAA